MTKSDKNRMISALAECLGNVSDACKKAGISRNTHYRWLKEDSEYSEAVSEQSEVALDIAEAMLMEKIAEGNLRAIIFFLKTKGKHRGYDEKRSISVAPLNLGNPIIQFGDTSKIDSANSDLTEEELEEIGYVDI